LIQAQVRLEEFDLIAYTSEPGLAPSLLVGKTVASTLSKLLKKPLVPIDHIMAHIFSNLLERHVEEIPFPAVCLTVSGGHNELYMWRSLFDLEKIGQTHDDAAGEAFDKVAKALGLGYPGGPIIAKLASEYPGKPSGIFPRVLLEKNTLDFSFSGLKSAVKREIDRLREIE
jgi:N6-L-threonylcarbamoyladenine synthase